MGYHYKLTLKEKMEFALWRLSGRHVSADTKRIACFIVIVLWLGMTGRLFLITLGVTAVFVAVFSMIVSVSKLRAKGCGGEQSIVIANGEFYYSAFGGGKVFCGDGRKMQRFGDLLLIFVVLPENGEEWLPVPIRIFENTYEQMKFRRELRLEHSILTGEEPEEKEGLLLRYCFGIDEKIWTKVQQEIRYRIKGQVFSTCVMVLVKRYIILVAWTLALALVRPETSAKRLVLDSVLFLALLILEVWKGDRGRMLRRRSRQEVGSDPMAGVCQLEFWDEEIICHIPGRSKSYAKWTEITEVIERRHVFSVFAGERNCFAQIVRNELSGEEEEQIRAIFRQKGVTWKLKKKRLLPAWVFLLLTAAGLALNGFLAQIPSVWKLFPEEYQIDGQLTDTHAGWNVLLGGGSKTTGTDSESSSADLLMEETDTSETEENVYDVMYREWKLKNQAKNLKEAGFRVEDSLLEDIMEAMQESVYLQESIVEEPYSWLLYRLGAPSYTNDVCEYSDQLFWCSTESWYVISEYIDTLKGMQALVSDEGLDKMGEFKQLTIQSGEEGSAVVPEVRIEWEGEVYSWKFETEKDEYGYDILDQRIFGVFNYFLDQEEGKRFYCSVDMEEEYEAYVFYSTEEWAEEFEKLTGMTLEAMITEPD